MNNKEVNKIEDTLNSMDGLQKASVNPYFYTRLVARMNKENSGWERFSTFITKPLVAFATICLILIMNAVFVFTDVNNSSTGKDSPELAVTDEYSQVSTSTLYDMENIKP